ncbi:MAG: glycoside hydrolase family 9 protein, partial [Bacteroidaceae bacterium]|nr:glycoside hydrolase family 9 protein [Bacteroidaceae bacterium]
MKRFLLFSALIIGGMLLYLKGNSQHGSLSSSLDEEIHLSNMLHSPLPLDGSRSLEAYQLRQPVLHSEAIPLDDSVSRWMHKGFGRMEYIADSGLCLTIPVHTGERAKGPDNDPDYATFGRASLSLDLNGRDLRPFTRMVMEVKPICQGVMIMNLNAVLQNAHPNGLGAHLINLTNNEWNTIVFDISGLERDSVWSLTLYTDLKGGNEALCDSISYVLRNLRLERVENPPKEIGWEVLPGSIAYSSTGYLTKGRKTAVVDSSCRGAFSLVDEESGKVCFTGKTEPIRTTLGSFGMVDFSSFTKPGRYRLQLEQTSTEPFLISDDAFLDTQWRLLNFIFCQRCGYEVPGIHGVCHQDVFCNHAGQEVCYGGGWHDAGDLSQQTLQTAEVAYSLLEAYLHNKDTHPLLAKRLLEEAEWGLRFILRCRFDDGFRASSLGLLHWTDSQTGTYDDIHSVRKQNNAFDNYLYAAYEAFASQVLPASSLCDSLSQAAKEDFHF